MNAIVIKDFLNVWLIINVFNPT